MFQAIIHPLIVLLPFILRCVWVHIRYSWMFERCWSGRHLLLNSLKCRIGLEFHKTEKTLHIKQNCHCWHYQISLFLSVYPHEKFFTLSFNELHWLQCLWFTRALCFLDKECPTWNQWNAWSQCAVSCGGGIIFRVRTCMNGIVGDPGCEGPNSENQTCATNVSFVSFVKANCSLKMLAFEKFPICVFAWQSDPKILSNSFAFTESYLSVINCLFPLRCRIPTGVRRPTGRIAMHLVVTAIDRSGDSALKAQSDRSAAKARTANCRPLSCG